MKLVIIDFNRTIYDPDTDSAVAGARELLEALRAKGIKLVMVSRQEGERLGMLERLGLSGFFEEVVFAEQKVPAIFSDIMLRHGVTPDETCVLGDHLHQEIRAGKGAGAYTILYKQGRFSSLESEGPHDVPDAVVEKLTDALHHIR